MKKPVRTVRRIVQRSFQGKGKGRSNGKETAGMRQAEVNGRQGNPKDANGKTTECDICHSTQHFRRECPQGDGRGRGPSIHLVQTDSSIQYVDWGSLLADPVDGSAST
eukprot:9124179-Pyramimonas_sp.AAC.1